MNIRFLFIFFMILQSPLWCAEDDDPISISPAIEKSINRGLEYLSKNQKSDGSWYTSSYGKNVGEVSLAIMSFMSMGNLPGDGKYGHVVGKGVDWIVKQSQASGLIQFKNQSQQASVMYGHALATLMLSEVWGQTRRDDVGKVLRKAVKLILQVQGRKGGWGYKSIPQDGDTSVCVMQMFALKSAYDAGIQVPSGTIEKAIKLIKTRYNKEKKMFGYSSTSVNIGHAGSSAAGACIMLICKEKDPKYVVEPIKVLYTILENEEKKGGKKVGHKNYFMYYGSVAAYYVGGEFYKKWVKKQEPFLLKKQGKNGSWKNSIHKTGFAILSMSLPYRYIPVYQH